VPQGKSQIKIIILANDTILVNIWLILLASGGREVIYAYNSNVASYDGREIRQIKIKGLS
jgi:hypothetical protein